MRTIEILAVAGGISLLLLYAFARSLFNALREDLRHLLDDL